MKLRILSFVKRSLATRMSLLTVFFAAIILIAALGYMFSVSRQAIRKEAVDRATNQLENTVLRVNNILDQVEVAANNTAWLINRHLDSPDLMFEYSRRIL